MLEYLDNSCIKYWQRGEKNQLKVYSEIFKILVKVDEHMENGKRFAKESLLIQYLTKISVGIAPLI